MTFEEIQALPPATYTRLIKASDTGLVYLIEAGNAGTSAQAVAVLSESGTISAGMMPSTLDARLKVLSGTTAALNTVGLQENELAIDTDKDAVVFGNARGNISDPVSVLESIDPTIGVLRADSSVAMAYDLGVGKFIFNGSAPPPFTVRVAGGATHARVVRWDGTLGAVKAATTDTSFTVSDWGTAIASPYTALIPKFGGIMPCNSSGSFVSGGYIARLYFGGLTDAQTASNVVAVDFDSMPNLQYFRAGGHRINRVGARRHAALISLELGKASFRKFSDYGFNILRTLNFDSCDALRSVELTSNAFYNSSAGSVIIAQCANLKSILAASSRVNSLSIYNCPSLTTLWMKPSDKLLALDIANCPALTGVSMTTLLRNIQNFSIDGCNAVSSLDFTGMRLPDDVGWFNSLTITNNVALSSINFGGTAVAAYTVVSVNYCEAMDYAALNAMFATLRDYTGEPARTINIANCGGSTTCDVSIAEARNWNVITE